MAGLGSPMSCKRVPRLRAGARSTRAFQPRHPCSLLVYRIRSIGSAMGKFQNTTCRPAAVEATATRAHPGSSCATRTVGVHAPLLDHSRHQRPCSSARSQNARPLPPAANAPEIPEPNSEGALQVVPPFVLPLNW
jgi:hypothetical protein